MTKNTVNIAVLIFDTSGLLCENRIPHNVNSGTMLLAEITISHAQNTSPGYCSRRLVP